MQRSQEQAWTLEGIDIQQYLKSLKNNKNQYATPPFTNLRYSLRNEYEIAELAEALDEKNIQSLITTPLQRLALFETVAFVSTHYQLRDEKDLADVVYQIYRTQLQPSLKRLQNIHDKQTMFLELAEKKSWEAAQEQEHGDVEYQRLYTKIYNKILQRIGEGKYKPHSYLNIVLDNKIIDTDKDVAAELARRYVKDQIYKKFALTYISDLIAEVVPQIISQGIIHYADRGVSTDNLANKVIAPLTTHSGNNRHNFMLFGAPACGKGTYNLIFAEYAEKQLGINWDDTLKVNTDTYRQFVSEVNINSNYVNDDTSNFSSIFNFDETRYILDRIYEIINQKLANNNSPHLFIDSVAPTDSKFEMGTKDGSALHVAVMTAAAEVSVNRAYNRGLETGRFVTISCILESHRNVSAQFLSTLSKHKNKNIKFIICDTTAINDKKPYVIASGNMLRNKVYILDPKKMGNFYAKKHINVKSQNPQMLFKTSDPKMDDSYKKDLLEKNIAVKHVKIKKGLRYASNQSLFSGNTPETPRNKDVGSQQTKSPHHQITLFSPIVQQRSRRKPTSIGSSPQLSHRPQVSIMSPRWKRKPFTLLKIESPIMERKSRPTI